MVAEGDDSGGGVEVGVGLGEVADADETGVSRGGKGEGRGGLVGSGLELGGGERDERSVSRSEAATEESFSSRFNPSIFPTSSLPSNRSALNVPETEALPKT